jgi:hypothetical protein
MQKNPGISMPGFFFIDLPNALLISIAARIAYTTHYRIDTFIRVFAHQHTRI